MLYSGSSLVIHFIIFLKFYLSIYFWVHWVFVAACGLSLVAGSGGYSLVADRRLLISMAVPFAWISIPFIWLPWWLRW